MTEFKLEGREYIELTDLLKVTGLLGSGGTAKIAIAEGLVLLDGKPELRRRRKVRPGHVVRYGDREVRIV